MDALIGILNNPITLTLVQLAFGLAVKRLPGLALVPNRLIPLLNAILALVVKVAGPGTANAGGFEINGHPFWGLVADSLVQTLFTTGLHSSAKNFWQQFAGTAINTVATRRR